MALKFKCKSKEERDGGLVLDVQGAVDKTKLDEFRTNNIALSNQLAETKRRFGGLSRSRCGLSRRAGCAECAVDGDSGGPGCGGERARAQQRTISHGVRLIRSHSSDRAGTWASRACWITARCCARDGCGPSCNRRLHKSSKYFRNPLTGWD